MRFLILTIALLISSTNAHAARVGEISYEDQERVRTRVERLSLTSFAFGPAWGSDLNNTSMFYFFHLGRNWEVNTNAEIRINLDGAVSHSNQGLWLSGSLGAAWLMSVEDLSPLVGAEFGYGYSRVKNANDPSGFMVGGFAGLRMFRTATAQMSVEAFAQSILDEENPVLAGVRVAVLF